MVCRQPGCVTSTCQQSFFMSSLEHVGGARLLVFECVPGHDLLNGDVGPGYEAHQPEQADDDVLDGHQRRQALGVKCHDLQQRRKDQRQEAAADRADQRDDQVQLGNQDSQDAWRGGGVEDGREREGERDFNTTFNFINKHPQRDYHLPDCCRTYGSFISRLFDHEGRVTYCDP